MNLLNENIMLYSSSFFSNHHASIADDLIYRRKYKPITHYIFTELSTRIPHHSWSDNPYDPTHQKWLSGRVNFCREHLLKSLKNQLFPHRWHPIIHPYPEDILTSIANDLGIEESDFVISDRSFSNNPFITQVYGVAREVRKFIYYKMKDRRLEESRIIISKIDSDDFYCKNFSYYLHASILSIDLAKTVEAFPFTLDLPSGFQYIVEEDNYLLSHWSENGFVNLITNLEDIYNPRKTIVTPFSFNHDKVAFGYKKISVCTHQPCWVSSIHDDNLINTKFKSSYSPSELPGNLTSFIYKSSE